MTAESMLAFFQTDQQSPLFFWQLPFWIDGYSESYPIPATEPMLVNTFNDALFSSAFPSHQELPLSLPVTLPISHLSADAFSNYWGLPSSSNGTEAMFDDLAADSENVPGSQIHSSPFANELRDDILARDRLVLSHSQTIRHSQTEQNFGAVFSELERRLAIELGAG